jgi:hypothetical protein
LFERWLKQRSAHLASHWQTVKAQLLPADWEARCARLQSVPDGNVGSWQPRAGSSSAELSLLVAAVPFPQRQWLATLLDSPAAGASALVESVERLQLDWRSHLDPVHSHREYARQLSILAAQLDLPAAAQAAYLENEQRIFAAVDQLLFASLPMRLRAGLLNRYAPGTGHYIAWWQQRLMARAGVQDHELEGLGPDDWPEMPAGWLALGWLCGLRMVAAGEFEPALSPVLA